ncbi:MAG: tRNA (adenosine(37)-N6)-dimethylallyltransferase MiaA [Anaerolineales bacterium]|jgi:tRNA dimethylallyltransferase|nr:tRNA (adenosine(37)-N6)-dimethylallyltransferase MiaA [Anaerolineales bacterium]
MPSPEIDAVPAAPPALDVRQPLVVLVGPTAVGKTELAIKLAVCLQAEIISADSRLFYRGMDIGTAKPGLAERSQVPHHLIDVVDPDETLSLAEFQKLAQATVAEIAGRGHLPILVGGTGQYIRAVTQGWEIPAVEPDPHLRRALQSWADQLGYAGLHQALAILDPVAARSIDARNLRRTMRALEVIYSTGRRFSDQRQRGESPYRILQLGLWRPRPELYARIDARIQDMLANGLIEEVRGLLVKGYSTDLPALSAIGYRQILEYLSGSLSLGEAVAQIQRATRVFVRRQANWFKPDDPDIHWFQAIDGVEAAVEKTVRQFLDRESGQIS